MTGLEPMFAISAGLSALSTASGIMQARQQEKYQRKTQAIQAQQARNEITALEEQKARAEEDRRDRLERAAAAQRAAFAASGVSSDGSGESVFANLLAESDKERRSYNAEIDRRIQGLNSGIQLNLLSRPGPDYLGALAGFGNDLMHAWDRYGSSPKPNSKTGG